MGRAIKESYSFKIWDILGHFGDTDERKCHSERSEGSRTSAHCMNTSFGGRSMFLFKGGCHLSCHYGCHFKDIILCPKNFRFIR